MFFLSLFLLYTKNLWNTEAKSSQIEIHLLRMAHKMQICDFLVEKYKSSKIFFVDSRKKSLGSLLFGRKSRVTVIVDFFGLSYNTNKRTQTQLEMCGLNYPKQLQTGYISHCVHKTCTLCLTTLYTKDCKTYSCLTCFLVLLNAGGGSCLSPSTSLELQS